MPSPGNQFLSDEFGDIEDYFVSDYTIIDQYIGDQLWVWGDPTGQGALGTRGISNISTPVTTFAGGTNWKHLGFLNSYSAAIKTDGTLWVWGQGYNGRLGNNRNDGGVNTPITTFAGGTDWKTVVAGDENMAAIKTDGTLWVWGKNGNTLGTNTSADILTPVTTFAGGNNWKQIDSFGTAIKTDGTLWTWGITPSPIPGGGTNWKQCVSGRAIKTDGTLWVWGSNYTGQLGINTTTNYAQITPTTTFAGGNNWKQVSGGVAATYAIKTDGTLWVWGANKYAFFSGHQMLGINATGIEFNDGGNISYVILTPVTTFAGGTNWKKVNANTAIKTDGTLWVWGWATLSSGTIDGLTKSTPVTTFAGGTNWKSATMGTGGGGIRLGLTVDLS